MTPQSQSLPREFYIAADEGQGRDVLGGQMTLPRSVS